ncbi:MAG: PASTA domain-containing protein [Clostridia bacterium]|jgi:hypothetical protein|nr:PASTA domain-containing protein [Clostridia bacterium]
MKKIDAVLKISLVVIITLGTIVFAGCNTDSNSVDINSSYDAIKKEYANNPSNTEIAFIYNAINGKISEYPKTVPDFINLPIECLIDTVGADERVNIEYIADEDYDNGLIIAQEPKSGEKWVDGAELTLTVNRKLSDINCKVGHMCVSSGKPYFVVTYRDSDNNRRGAIWADEGVIVNDEISRIYADNGSVYYNDQSGVRKLNGESVLELSVEDPPYFLVNDEKIYYFYKEEAGIYCYNMNDRSNSLIHDEFTLFIANSDYIIFQYIYDIIILDSKNNTVVKQIHSDKIEKIIADFSLDGDNLYYVLITYYENGKEKSELIKYSIEKDTHTTVMETSELVSDIYTVDDKIVYSSYVDDSFGIKYVDMRTMRSKFYNLETDIAYDLLFDGQQIIYTDKDYTTMTLEIYSISVFTGETKKIGSFAFGYE